MSAEDTIGNLFTREVSYLCLNISLGEKSDICLYFVLLKQNSSFSILINLSTAF